MSYENMQVNQVHAFLDLPGSVALDIRDRKSFEDDHLRGAEHADEICMGQLLRKRKRNPPVLVYCEHGESSRDFADLVNRMGFDRVYNLEGGWQAWSEFATD